MERKKARLEREKSQESINTFISDGEGETGLQGYLNKERTFIE